MRTGTKNSQRTANTPASYTKQELSKQPQIKKRPEKHQKQTKRQLLLNRKKQRNLAKLMFYLKQQEESNL
jgi:hypothetical protein